MATEAAEGRGDVVNPDNLPNGASGGLSSAGKGLGASVPAPVFGSEISKAFQDSGR